MAINFENKYETERRINTPATEKTVDKLYGAMYNDGNSSTKSDVGNYVKKQPTQPDTTKRFGFAPEINSWAKKNQDAIKYAGDGAINSIKKASNDYLNEYLKDAPEETDKDELFGSIAKWQLARDANDEKRGNVARNNIIGHMSTENKDHYLKEQIPFSEYVKAKDDFDYKTGNYTTTEYASKTIDEAVKRLQQKLNENGYTDNYGNKLNEDGTVGSKTLQAYDSYENEQKNEVEAQHMDNDFEFDTTKPKKLVPDEHQNDPLLLVNSGKKLASAGGPIPTKDMATVVNATQTAETENTRFDKEGLERYHNTPLLSRSGTRSSVGAATPTTTNYQAKSVSNNQVNSQSNQNDINTKIENIKFKDATIKPKGYLSEGDEQYSESKQKLIRCASFSWYNNDGNDAVQNKIHGQTQRLRWFDEDNIEKAYLLNNSNGAYGLGHNAVMLVDKNGRGIIFSVFSSGGNILDTNAELRFSALSKEKVDAFVNNHGMPTWIFDMVATDSAIQDEKYDKLVKFDITNDVGSRMFEFAVNRYNSPGDYKLLSENCNDFALNCLKYGDIDIFRFYSPNNSYMDAKALKLLNNIKKLLN